MASHMANMAPSCFLNRARATATGSLCLFYGTATFKTDPTSDTHMVEMSARSLIVNESHKQWESNSQVLFHLHASPVRARNLCCPAHVTIVKLHF